MQNEKYVSEEFDEYILIAPGSDYGQAMWSDINLLENGKVLENTLRCSNKLLCILHHIHFSFFINSFVKLPLQFLWRNQYSLESVKLDDKKKYSIIYTDISAGRTDIKYLSKLSLLKNVTLVLIIVNTMKRREKILKSRLKFFAYVFTFDKKDAEQYKFFYHPANYSMHPMEREMNPITDAFFVGISKGRGEKLGEVFERLTDMGLKANFFISGVKKGEKRYQGIHYNQWLEYKEVLKHIRETNCIVEIMEGKQEGLTLRAMEAICYNKRLLTNNKSIQAFPFYKSGYIQIFDEPKDIDINFVQDKKLVDYHYRGEFSPLHLIEHINELKALDRRS